MRVTMLAVLPLLAAAPALIPAMAHAPDSACATQACLQAALRSAMQRRLGMVADLERRTELMTAQVLWEAYREMQCGDDEDCRMRQARWRLRELEAPQP